jgi:hypothetical protein
MLAELREQGVIGTIGSGMNQSAMLARFLRETAADVVMLAGRFTLGMRTARQVERNVELHRGAVPQALWDELRDKGLIRSYVPTGPRPGARGVPLMPDRRARTVRHRPADRLRPRSVSVGGELHRFRRREPTPDRGFCRSPARLGTSETLQDWA